MVPALLLVLLIVLGRLDRYDAEMASEIANFDREFSKIQHHFAESPKTKEFWEEQYAEAENRFKKSRIEQARAKGITDQHVDIIEKTLMEMEERE